jgi:hypothetical protein
MRAELKNDGAAMSARVSIAAQVLPTCANQAGPQLAAVEALRYADALMELSGWNQMRVDAIAEGKKQQAFLQETFAAVYRPPVETEKPS